jgi:hypothetical protein
MAMPESFLQLDANEQSQIYRALSPKLSRSPVVLEKDVWVCCPHRKTARLKNCCRTAGSRKNRNCARALPSKYLSVKVCCPLAYRKAWLFSDTPAGARASAVIYSLVQTAKANGLEPYT